MQNPAQRRRRLVDRRRESMYEDCTERSRRQSKPKNDRLGGMGFINTRGICNKSGK